MNSDDRVPAVAPLDLERLFVERVNAGDVGDLALGSTRLADGGVTAEVARCQPDGTWLWVIDQWSVVGD